MCAVSSPNAQGGHIPSRVVLTKILTLILAKPGATAVYHLAKCRIHPVLFSPRQKDAGVVYTDGKMLPPPSF